MPVLSFLHKNKSDAIIRPLTLDDRNDVEKLIATDPVGFLHAAEHLEHFGLPVSSSLSAVRSPQGFMGIFASQVDASAGGVEQPAVRSVQSLIPVGVRQSVQQTVQRSLSKVGRSAGAHFAETGTEPGTAETLNPAPQEPRLAMVGAFWLGVNCVPIVVPETHHQQVAQYILRQHKRIASIFGRRDAVMGVWQHLKGSVPQPFDVRERQPLLYLPPSVVLDGLAGAAVPGVAEGVLGLDGEVRWAQTRDRVSLLKASVEMFCEEVGYDPLQRDAVGYTRRVDELTRQGRTVVAVNSAGAVVFKVDLGLAHADHCQLQGVWLHPDYRGRGLSTVLFARACQLIRQRFPHLSLYVNDYNRTAQALYKKTGWIQRGDFATILF